MCHLGLVDFSKTFGHSFALIEFGKYSAEAT